jgi:hypothetical protein
MTWMSKSRLIAVVSLLGWAGASLVAASQEESAFRAAALVLQFDGKSITFEGEPDFDVVKSTLEAGIDRRGVDGLRIESIAKSKEEKLKGMSIATVPLVGEKKSGYYRFLNTAENVAEIATEDRDEAIRLLLERCKVREQGKKGE